MEAITLAIVGLVSGAAGGAMVAAFRVPKGREREHAPLRIIPTDGPAHEIQREQIAGTVQAPIEVPVEDARKGRRELTKRREARLLHIYPGTGGRWHYDEIQANYMALFSDDPIKPGALYQLLYRGAVGGWKYLGGGFFERVEVGQ